MLGMQGISDMMEQEVEAQGDPIPIEQAGAMAAEQEPQVDVEEIMENMKEHQEKLIEQVTKSQQTLQRRLEDAVCKGLEGITAIRYGAQAKEFHQETQVEHERMRGEMRDEMDHLIDVIHSTQTRSVEATTQSLQQLSSNMGELSTLIMKQQEGFNSAIQGMSKMISESMTAMLAQSTQMSTSKTTLVGGDNQHNRVPTKEIKTSTLNQQKKTRRTRNYSETSSSSQSERSESEKSDSEAETSRSTVRARSSQSSHQGGHKSNIPPFTGKETWKVWFTRFKDIAKRQGWDDEEKLDILLPKLQGEAGSFVYDQLGSKTRNNYQLLTKELKNRFRQIENPKTFSAVFAARRQRSKETRKFCCGSQEDL